MNKTNKVNYKQYDDDGIKALAIAITHQAALDYQEALDESKYSSRADEKLDELDEWFDSSLGKLCSFGNSGFIREQIRKGVEVIGRYLYDREEKPIY